MATTRPPYPPEFRAEAVRLVRAGGTPLAQVARDLGVPTFDSCAHRALGRHSL
jgi:transposase-like protein